MQIPVMCYSIEFCLNHSHKTEPQAFHVNWITTRHWHASPAKNIVLHSGLQWLLGKSEASVQVLTNFIRGVLLSCFRRYAGNIYVEKVHPIIRLKISYKCPPGFNALICHWFPVHQTLLSSKTVLTIGPEEFLQDFNFYIFGSWVSTNYPGSSFHLLDAL